MKKKNKTFRIIFLVTQWILIIYGLGGIAIYYLQDKFLFHPISLSSDHVFHLDATFEEKYIPLSDKDTINLIRMMPADDTITLGAVLFFHGNAGNVECHTAEAEFFLRHHYEVWMPDYPGFGKSRGDLSETKLHEMAYQVKRLANRYFPDERMIVYGRSFGTGVAAGLAAAVKVRSLVLVSPYYSIPDLFSSYVPIYPMKQMAHFQLPVNEYLNDVAAPVMILHGTNDNLIPPSATEKLKSSLKKGDKVIMVEGAGHNDIINTQEYTKSLEEMLL